MTRRSAPTPISRSSVPARVLLEPSPRRPDDLIAVGDLRRPSQPAPYLLRVREERRRVPRPPRPFLHADLLPRHPAGRVHDLAHRVPLADPAVVGPGVAGLGGR